MRWSGCANCCAGSNRSERRHHRPRETSERPETRSTHLCGLGHAAQYRARKQARARCRYGAATHPSAPVCLASCAVGSFIGPRSARHLFRADRGQRRKLGKLARLTPLQTKYPRYRETACRADRCVAPDPTNPRQSRSAARQAKAEDWTPTATPRAGVRVARARADRSPLRRAGTRGPAQIWGRQTRPDAPAQQGLRVDTRLPVSAGTWGRSGPPPRQISSARFLQEGAAHAQAFTRPLQAQRARVGAGLCWARKTVSDMTALTSDHLAHFRPHVPPLRAH